jgi:hypothetical protein
VYDEIGKNFRKNPTVRFICDGGEVDIYIHTLISQHIFGIEIGINLQMRFFSISIVSWLVTTLNESHGFSAIQPLKELHDATVSKTAIFMADEARKQVKEYKSAMSAIRTEPNGGPKPIDVVMKFGGSSLANYERIDHVAQLIKDQIKNGYRPRAIVCSAMGKTTNNLLSAGDFALGKFKK